jgi:hypothetical protein
MISLKRLIEQPDLPEPETTEDGFDKDVTDTAKELDKDSNSPSVDEYMQKVNAYMSKKGNGADWVQLQPHLAMYYDKIADDSVKQRMYNDIGTVTANATDVDAMNSQIASNIYLTTGELNNLGRQGGITTKAPYNLPMVNPNKESGEGGGKNPGAGELSFQLAHNGIIWVGRNYSGDAVYKDGDKEYVIDVKDDRKISPEVPGVDIANKTKYKLFFDNTKFLELQKKVELMLKFIRAYNNYANRMDIFKDKDAEKAFLQIKNELMSLFGKQENYEFWLKQMQRLNRENGITISLGDTDTDLRRNQHLLALAQKGGSDTLKFQCFLNNLGKFVATYQDSINDNTYGTALKRVILDEIFTPNWFIQTLQDSVNLGNNEYLENLTYDYILVASKTGGKPMYFRSKKDDALVISLYAKRKNDFLTPDKDGKISKGGPDSLIMNFDKYLDTVTYDNLSNIDACAYKRAARVKKAKAVQHLVRNNK